MSKDRKPAEVFAPGEYIEEEMEERRWTRVDMLERLGQAFDMQQLNAILEGRTALTDGMAARVADVFGQNAQTWMNLERTYRDDCKETTKCGEESTQEG